MATSQHASTRLQDGTSSTTTDTPLPKKVLPPPGPVITNSSSTYKLMAAPGSIYTTSDATRRSIIVDTRLCCFDSYILSFDYKDVSVLEDVDDTLLQMVYLDEESCDLTVSIVLRHEAWVDHHIPFEDAESTSDTTTTDDDDNDSGLNTEESPVVEMMDVSE